MSPAAKEESSKKRKTSSSSSATSPSAKGGASASSMSIPNQAALHSAVTKLEEDQARRGDPGAETHAFGKTADRIRDAVNKVHATKIKKGPGAKASPAEVSELRVSASLDVLALKKLNRLDKLRARDSREGTRAAKQKVDSLHLRLQNLLYEAMHLQKEIVKCQQFRSKDEDVELVSVDEFRSAGGDDALDEPHALHLARLDHEDKTRREMNGALRKLEEGKERLEDIIKTKRDNLSGLGPQLRKILDATRPTQEYLKMPLTAEWEQGKMCQFLPAPLFVLYSQTAAYGRACDPDGLSAEVVGDMDEARRFHARKLTADDDEEEDDDDDSANVTNEEEDDGGKKSKRGKGAATGGKQMSKQEERLRRLLQVHPLQVRVRVALDGDGGDEAGVLLTFAFLHRLQVVSVKVKLDSVEDAAPTGVLQPSLLLSHLLQSGDGGAESPNPANRFQLSEVGYPGGVIPARHADEVGSLYRWAQTLAGLSHSSSSSSSGEVDEELSVSSVKEVITAVRERARSRAALHRQISQLEKAKLIQVEPAVPESALALFPASADPTPSGGRSGSAASSSGSKIRNWTSVDWEQYTALGVTRHLVEAGAVSGEDFFYRLQVNRDPASLIALIAVKPDYPSRAPVFCLNLHWRGEHNLGNSENIRALERLVNTCFDEEDLSSECRSHLLSLQLRRLLTSLDALLESWNAADKGDKVDFPREKLFLKAVRGRTRALPLNYDPKLQLFSHR